MDLLITGIPGPLLKWTSELVKTVAKPVRPAVALGGSGADASPAQSAGSDPDVLVAGHLDPKHEAAVLAGTLRAVVVVDDAGTCLAAQQSSGKRLVNAARDLINCATPFGRLAGCRNVHVVTRHDPDPMALIRQVLQACGWAADADAPAEIVQRFAAACPLVVPVAAGDAALVEQALQPAFGFAATGVRGEVTWSRAVMLWGDHPNEPAPRILDLTGPSRVLAYGPYFCLAPGRWTARFRLAFSPQCQDAPFALEMHTKALLGRCRFRVPRAGLFEATFPFAVASGREPIEMRLVSERGAIEGTLGIDHAVLTPIPG